MFVLHPQLQNDCLTLGNFPLCRLLLMLDANYPWFILVPERSEIYEIFQLRREDQIQLLDESSALSVTLSGLFPGSKLNIAMLGNIVSQLHIHHVVRYNHDPAWPGPIWGKLPRVEYGVAELQKLTGMVLEALPGSSGFIPAESFSN